MVFDMTASTNSRKLMLIDPEFPKNVTTTVIRGQTASATFEAKILEHGRPAEYTYQWYVNETPVQGATDAVYIRDVSESSDSEKIYCAVSNKKGTMNTRIANLTVLYAPLLNESYPNDATVDIGKSATCEVTIKEDGNPAEYTYQWYKNDTAISGATASSYTVEADAVGSMTLHCVVTNAAGSVTSRKATITCAPYYIFKDGSFADGGTYGFRGDDSEDEGELRNGVLYLYDQSRGWASMYTTNKYDFTNQNNLYFRCPSLHSDGSNSTFYFGVADTQADSSYIASYAITAHSSPTEKTFVVDVSEITGEHYVKFGTVREEYGHIQIYVDQIYFG